MNSTRRQFLHAAAIAGAASCAWATLPALASSYPDRPVKWLVPYPVGGVVDIVARIVADGVAAQWGQPVVVENRAGANGNIGADAVKNSKADGYTVLVGSMFVVINPLIDRTARFTPRDFEPIAAIGAPPNLLVVPSSSPVQTLQEFVALARKNPGKFNTPNPGTGSSNHLGLELFVQAAGIDLVQVNYKGQPPFMVDLMNGQLQFGYVTTALALPQVVNGKLRVLAVASDQRLKALPNVPTLAEAGYPGTAVLPWNGLFAPAGTPRAVTEVIATEVERALRNPEIQRRYDTLNAEAPSAPGDFPRSVQSEAARWKTIVAQRNITADAL